MSSTHLHGSMAVDRNIAPDYEMIKRRHMAAILHQINCQLTATEYGNMSPYWTLATAQALHEAQQQRELATTAFLDQYWLTVRRSYADLGVLCMPPFSIPLDCQRPVDDPARWQADGAPVRRQHFPPILVTHDGFGFHEYILAHAEVNGQPYPNYDTPDQGRKNTLVFALADDQYIPDHSTPPMAPQLPTPQQHRRSLARASSFRSSRASTSRRIPAPPRPSTPPQPDTIMPYPQSGLRPYNDELSVALAAAKSLLQYPESEPFRQELKLFIDLLIETRASEARSRTALSNPKFLKRLSKFMRWYEDIEGERTLGKRLLFKVEDQPRLRDFFNKLTHVRETNLSARPPSQGPRFTPIAPPSERQRPVVISRQTLDLERVEQALGAFQHLVEQMADEPLGGA